MLPGWVCQPRAAAWFHLPILTACNGTPNPPYIQTSGSQAAFALFEQVQSGARRDLPEAARAAGLVDAGVCHEVGAGRLYCNALRFTEAEYYGPSNDGPSFSLAYEEFRFCLAQSQAVGFRAGRTAGDIPLQLFREYPEEFATVPGAPSEDVQPDPRFGEKTFLRVADSMTDLSADDALLRLGYRNTESGFELINGSVYTALDYPDHADGQRACRAL